jgi:PTH1 family peptidyl-tRNA hydrolase
MAIRCIIGLGNPGPEYVKTRHNAGAWFVELLAQKDRAVFRLDKKLRGSVAEITEKSQRCFLFIPATYMNESGIAVSAFLKFHKININDVLVAHDELDFEPGDVRLKLGGGHGGHNGLRDIIAHLSADFYRLRIGIGHPGNRDDVSDYVLSKPSRDNHERIMQSIHAATNVVPELVAGEFQKAFHLLHS